MKHFYTKNMNLLILFKEKITVYAENDSKHINTKCSFTDCYRTGYK